MRMRSFGGPFCISVIAGLAWATTAFGQTAAPGRTDATPADPYPISAAGWGPPAGDGRFMSRWAEDWTGLRAVGDAPPLKAIPLTDEASLTLSTELRFRHDAYDNAGVTQRGSYAQSNVRGLVGADLRFNPNIRVYAEVGTAGVDRWPGDAPANFRNDAALQQLFVEGRGHLGSMLVGAMIGRQEFADGPRQFLSIADGPNLRRTWNGVRLYAHGGNFRVGAFHLRSTRLAPGWFDEGIDDGVELYGLNASFIVSPGRGGSNIYLDPFWYHTTNPTYRSGGRSGLDTRDTYGARLRGRRGTVSFDWTLARQTGRYIDRDVNAWGVFLVNSVALSGTGWKPRLTARLDATSGGGAYGPDGVKDFNPLYGSGQYLSEGLLLSNSNLVILTPGLTVSPTPDIDVAIEYGFARRLTDKDAAYAGLMRPYAGTQTVAGHEIGGLFRLYGTWAAGHHVSVFANVEYLSAGDVLLRAGQPSGRFANIGMTYRY